ncbi:sugar phosphate exchanger 3 [Trichuris trichiura]|uniref:Sugar phosphate exchanger 3 n=1 Tax=Trichuris trichiura TaxID=36087 RepID=A0A077Z182_TRITR|nr:sugar phosphate exchanger 3 [Trichuris trichiura]
MEGQGTLAAASLRRSFTYQHVFVFVLTFFSYALLHASRKTFSNVKSTMISTWTPENLNQSDIFDNETWNGHTMFHSHFAAEAFLGVLDAVFMSCYAIVSTPQWGKVVYSRLNDCKGLFISGMLGDRYDPRIVLSVGMWGSAVMIFLFGTLTEWTQFYSTEFYVFVWMLNGFIQSAGWPAEVCIMANWFGHGGRGFVLGLWAACASVGNIIGSELCSSVLPYGYENAFLVNATFLFCGGFFVYYCLVSSPVEVGLPEPLEEVDVVRKDDDDDEEELLNQTSSALAAAPKNPILLKQAVLLPGVIPVSSVQYRKVAYSNDLFQYSLAFACLKLVNYSFFFWLPFYLTNNFGWPEYIADHISTWYDWGGICGGVLGGIVSDWIGKRTPVVVAQLIFGVIALSVYSKSPNDRKINSILMGVSGFFCSGAGNLISAAVSADLGRQKEVLGNAKALSTVTGIVDGSGSVGAAFGQLIIPVMEVKIGWMSVFYLFILLVSCLLRIAEKTRVLFPFLPIDSKFNMLYLYLSDECIH